jgi:hypothetical protein
MNAMKLRTFVVFTLLAGPAYGSFCTGQVSQLLKGRQEKWGVWLSSNQKRVLEPTWQTGDWYFRSSPTAKVQQEWSVSKTALSFLTRDLKANKVKKVTVSRSDCKVAVVEEKLERKPAGEVVFSDYDLYGLTDDRALTLVYTWSPAMPLSFLEMAEIISAAKKLNARLVILLDPFATPEDIAKVKISVKVDSAWIRKWDSDELRIRGFGLHYPSTVLLAQGKISRIFAGQKNSEEFIKWVKYENDHIKNQTDDGIAFHNSLSRSQSSLRRLPK